jgi:cytochrome c553
MKQIVSLLALAAAALTLGCSTPDRSRNLGNPNTPASALAMQVCSNCHGIDGNSTSPNFPNLAAQQEAYFIEQLKSFKSHGRFDPEGFEYMWGISRSLSDEQIKGLAAYFAKQTPKANLPGDTKLLSAGKDIFEKGVAAQNIPACMVCHGPQGQGNASFPRIANQHADYIIKQLHVFQRTDERPEGAVMKPIAHSLTAENVAAVAAYLEAMPLQ